MFDNPSKEASIFNVWKNGLVSIPRESSSLITFSTLIFSSKITPNSQFECKVSLTVAGKFAIPEIPLSADS